MPPNPTRQAQMAQRRAEMANDPELARAAQEAGEHVLRSYETTPTETGPARTPGPTPRAAVPSRGGGGRGAIGGGGSTMKTNIGRKGALPPPEFDIKLFNYQHGGKVLPNPSFKRYSKR